MPSGHFLLKIFNAKALLNLPNCEYSYLFELDSKSAFQIWKADSVLLCKGGAAGIGTYAGHFPVDADYVIFAFF